MTQRLGSLTAVWVLSGDAVWTHEGMDGVDDRQRRRRIGSAGLGWFP